MTLNCHVHVIRHPAIGMNAVRIFIEPKLDQRFPASPVIVFKEYGLTVIASQEKPFSELIAPLQRYSHSGEINFAVDDKAGKMKEIAEKFSDAEVDHLDGVTCQYADWWCNVRPSNTEPLLRLSLEADNEKMMQEKLISLVTEIIKE